MHPICLTAVLLVSAAEWPQFRGPDGQGHAPRRSQVPVSWSETQNITWKMPIPGRGWSSPAIADGKVWLTTATEDGHSLRALAIDAVTGKTLHDVEVFRKDDPGAIHSKNSHASPTAIIEEDRVYVHYGAHGTACLSTSGDIVWRNNELKHNHQHGPGGSPVVWHDLLILNCDGTDVQFVVALDKETGKIRWNRPRAHIGEPRRTGKDIAPMAYSTPLIIDVAGRPQLVSVGADSVVAYEPASGEEIWWSRFNGYSNVARPVFGHGMVFISSGYGPTTFYAIKVDGHGDVTDSKVAWKINKGMPVNSSPLIIGDEIYVLSDSGILTCLDVASGKRHWQKRIGGNFSASPLYAGGRIYLLDEAGNATVIRPGKKYELVGTNKLDGRTLASPAVARDAIFLRTETHLYRIEQHHANKRP